MFIRQWLRVIATLLLAFWGSSLALYAYILPIKGYPKLEVSGNNNLSFNLNKVEGSQSYFRDDNFGRESTFSQSSNIHLSGDLMKDLSVSADFLADPYATDNLNWHLRYNGSMADVLVGEFNADLGGNEYVLLNRSLLGVKVDSKLRKGSLSFLASDLQAPVHTDTLYGQNVSGPYYLTATPVVDGSEVVLVNDVKKVRGTDYTLDNTNGILNFLNGQIISPSDRVVVSYEVQVGGLGGGKLYGLRASYPVMRNLTVGVSRVQLDGRTRTVSEKDQRDQFLGTGTVGPFYLTQHPVVQDSEVVTVNSALQERGTAYTIDYSTGKITFQDGFAPASGATVIVNYRAQSGDRDQFLGTGTPGPFYLTKRPIISNSEVVTLNGVVQTRDTAYTLDYQTGRLLFKTGFEPPYGSTIIVRYSTSKVQSESGNREVTGVDVNWRASNALTVDMQAAKSSQRAPTVTPAEQVNSEPLIAQPGVPLTAQTFRLRKTPIQENTDTISAPGLPVEARILVRGQDYTLDYATGELHVLKTGIPTPATGPALLASYTTQASTRTYRGDSAVSIGGSFNKGRLAATARLRQVDPGFSPLEMVGYRNVEKSLEWSLRYAVDKFMSLLTTGNNTRLPYNPYANTADGQLLMDEKNRTYSLEYQRPNWPTLSLRRTTQDSTQVGTDSLGNSNTTDSFSAMWAKNAISASLYLTRVATDSRQLRYSSDPFQPLPDNPQPTDPIFTFQGVTNNALLNLMYQPNERLNLGVNLSANKIKSTQDGQDTSTGGNNVSMNAMYKPVKNVTLNANIQSSKTDATRTVTGGDVPSQSTRYLTVGANWQASNKLSFGTNFTQDRTEGGLYSNSSSSTLSANARWAINDRLKLDGYWFNQALEYLDASGRSKSNMVGANAQVGVFKKATLDLGIQHLWGDTTVGVNNLLQSQGMAMRTVPTRVDPVGATVTGNKLTTITGKLTIPISKRQDVYLTGESTRNNGFPSQSDRYSYGLGWNYHLNQNLTFTMDAGRVSYNDSANPGLNYNANQLSSQFSWNF